MARTKSKRKNKEKPDSKDAEDKKLLEQKEEGIELQQQESGSEQSVAEKKKLKKEIQLNEPLIDYEVNKNNKEDKYEEFPDENVDKAVDEVEMSKKLKKKKSKEKKTIEELEEENSSENKRIKVFNFGQHLTANIPAVNGQTALSLNCKRVESTEITIDMTAEEWMNFKHLIPQIDDLINNNNLNI